jgi:hypothetical protein
MKKVFPVLGFLVANLLLAQAPPQGIPYQGIARDAQGNAINGTIGVQITIHQGPSQPNIVYQEEWTPTTNQFGLFTIVIGTSSNVIQGSFAAINWSADVFFLEVGIDPAGGTNYTSLGSTQFYSVPYAFHAGTATSGNPGPQGPTGPTGLTGPTGPTGPSSIIPGNFGQTLYHDGSLFTPTSNLYNNGNLIGINTTTPNYTLDVNGTINTGVLYVANYQMPPSDGLPFQVVTTNGSGSLYFSTLNGTPAGTYGQTMYNDGFNWLSTSNLYHNGQKVGIGTTTPSSFLHIFPQNSPSTLMVESGLNFDARVDVRAPLGQTAIFGLSEGSNYFANLYVTGSKLFIQDGSGVPTMTFSNKKVGIGNQTPGSDLTIQSLGTNNTSSALNILNGLSQNLLFVRNDGAVGIGNTNPMARLDISGMLRVNDGSQGSGKIFVSDNTGLGKWQVSTAITSIPLPNCGGSLSNVSTTAQVISNSTVSFTKSNVDTKIGVVLQTLIIVDDLVSSFGVIYEIRIDGAPACCGQGKLVYNRDNGNTAPYDANEPVTMIAEFTGLGMGSHTVSVYAYTLNGTAVNARFDNGCWNTGNVTIKEYW